MVGYGRYESSQRRDGCLNLGCLFIIIIVAVVIGIVVGDFIELDIFSLKQGRLPIEKPQ